MKDRFVKRFRAIKRRKREDREYEREVRDAEGTIRGMVMDSVDSWEEPLCMEENRQAIR